MKRTRKRLTLCVILLIANLALIWLSSCLDGQSSSALSGFVGQLIRQIFPNAPVGSGQTGHGLLRKLGHVTEFCCLGMVLSWLFGMLRSKTWQRLTFPLAAGVAAALLDEGIQRFVPGRCGALTDVGIDTLGIVLGIVLIYLSQFIIQKFGGK